MYVLRYLSASITLLLLFSVVLSAGQRQGQVESLAIVEMLIHGSEREKLEASGRLQYTQDRDAIDAILIYLNSKKTEERQRASWALGLVQAPSIIPALFHCVEDSDWLVVRNCVFALGNYREERVFKKLSGLFKKNKNSMVRVEILRSLAKIYPQRSLPLLFGALKKSDTRDEALLLIREAIDCKTPGNLIRRYLNKAGYRDSILLLFRLNREGCKNHLVFLKSFKFKGLADEIFVLSGSSNKEL